VETLIFHLLSFTGIAWGFLNHGIFDVRGDVLKGCEAKRSVQDTLQKPITLGSNCMHGKRDGEKLQGAIIS
jgi:hypothetical protein